NGQIISVLAAQGLAPNQVFRTFATIAWSGHPVSPVRDGDPTADLFPPAALSAAHDLLFKPAITTHAVGRQDQCFCFWVGVNELLSVPRYLEPSTRNRFPRTCVFDN